MSASSAEASRPTGWSTSLPWWQWVSLGTIALVFAGGAWLQAQVHLNHDVAWITHGAGWLLEGRRFGRDIIDVNPPLIWFVSIPAALFVKAGLFSEPVAIRVYVWALCLAVLALCARLLQSARRPWGQVECAALLAGAAYSMAVLPAAAFAQREHLAFVLGLPYVLLLAMRAQGLATSSRMAAACGVLAAIAFGFKPWFLAVPMLLELPLLVKQRSVRNLLRPETVTLAGTLVAYLLAILLFASEYITDVIPMGRATYWAYDGTGAPWYYWRAAALPVVVALVFLVVARRFPPPARALTAAFAGFSLAYWAQGKGFSYHAYPALAFAFTMFAYAIPQAARVLRDLKLPVASWIKIGMAACVVAFAMHCTRVWSKPVVAWYDKYEAGSGEVGAFRTDLIARINAAVPRGGYVYAFSSHPFPAFPTISYTDAEWGSPLAGQFAVPALLARKRLDDPAQLAALDAAVNAQREQVLADFQRHAPALVLIETRYDRLGMRGRRFDDVAFYSQDPRFAAIWRHYAEVEPIGTLRVFVRRG